MARPKENLNTQPAGQFYTNACPEVPASYNQVEYFQKELDDRDRQLKELKEEVLRLYRKLAQYTI